MENEIKIQLFADRVSEEISKIVPREQHGAVGEIVDWAEDHNGGHCILGIELHSDYIPQAVTIVKNIAKEMKISVSLTFHTEQMDFRD